MQTILNALPRVAVLTLVALASSACSSTGGGAQSIQLTQIREVPHFSKIEASGPLELTVTVGAPLGVSVRGAEQRLAELTTEVVGGVLRVQLDRAGGDPVAVQVGLPHLSELTCSGRSNSRISGLRGGQLRLDLQGLGELWAEGSVDRLTGSIDGPGTMNLSQLAVRVANVSVRGSGKAEVTVSGSLDAQVAGGGDVIYHGDPIVTADTSGSGSISPRR